jgi:nitrite reductase/ring-hydroxylating ferredoxin subunit
MIEYSDVEERKKALAKLIGVEKSVWVKVEDSEKVFAISNEDLSRENEDKTASVHFMRFELNKGMCAQAKVGLPITFGIDHPLFKTEVTLSPEIQQSLIKDLD